MIISSIISIAIFVLQLITAWKVFEKYGEPGWKAFIPFYSDYIQFGKVWNTTVGIAYIVLTILSVVNLSSESKLLGTVASIASLVLFVLTIMYANKKSKAFGCGLGTTLLLILFPFIANLYIGFNDSIQYQGNTTN